MKASLLLALSLLFACGGTDLEIGETKQALSTTQDPNGNGTYQQMFTVGSASHYQNVDEGYSWNDWTDYNYTKSVNQMDSYTISLSSIPNSYDISRIKIGAKLNKLRGSAGDGTNATGQLFYRWNGVNSSMTNTGALDTWTIVVADYTGLSLNKDSGSTLEIGAKYTGCSGAFCTLRDMALTGMEVLIEYAP